VIRIAVEVVAWFLLARAVVRRADGGVDVLGAVTAAVLALAAHSVATAAILVAGVDEGALSPLDAVRAALLAAGVALARRRGRADVRGAPSPRAHPVLVAAAVVAVAASVANVVIHSARLPDGSWDAYGVWNIRARMLVRAPGDQERIFSPLMAMSHPDYPLFLPGLVASGWRVVDGAPVVPVAVALLGLLACIGAVGAAALRLRGPSAAGAAVAALLAVPMLVRAAGWQYADVWAAAHLSLAVAWLFAASAGPPERARGRLALAGACAACGAWTKNEGLLHLVALAGAGALLPPPGVARSRATASFLLGAAPLVAVVLATKAGLAPANDLVHGAAAGRGVAPLLDPSRWSRILSALAAELASTARWNALLPLGLALLVVPRRRAAPSPGRAPVVAIVAVLVGYAAVYALTPHDLGWHLRWSVSRLLLHVWPAVCLALAVRHGDLLASATGPPGTASPAATDRARGTVERV
jgi:hypothetical protein